MSISSSQLETWSSQGATTTPKTVREKIENTLRSSNSKIQHIGMLDIYLQGSYRNSTNIHGNSDVDIVVQSNQTYYYDTSELTSQELTKFNDQFLPSTYGWDQYKQEIVTTLQIQYGTPAVKVGNKSIKVSLDSFEADVVPCFEYRKYKSAGDPVPGITLFTTNDKIQIINYPKLHIENGVNKNQNCDQMYKPLVRIFKNIKKKLIADGKISKDLAPSYFLENLLYNVPKENFIRGDYSLTVHNILKYFYHNQDKFEEFVCQNYQSYLFGTSQVQWRIDNANSLLTAIITLWNEG